MIAGFECRMVEGEQIDIGSWTQLTNFSLGSAEEGNFRSGDALKQLWLEPGKPKRP
jgi:hypothetical protein